VVGNKKEVFMFGLGTAPELKITCRKFMNKWPNTSIRPLCGQSYYCYNIIQKDGPEVAITCVYSIY